MNIYQFKIGNKTTFDNYRIFIKEAPHFKPPELNDYKIDVPFRNGSIDMTEALLGRATFKNRKIEIICFIKSEDEGFLTKFINNFHGQKEKIFFDEDKYFIGRISVSEIKRSKMDSFIEFRIQIEAEPFKLALKNKGVHLVDLKDNSEFYLTNEGYPAMAKIECEKSTNIFVNGDKFSNTDDIEIPHGKVHFKIEKGMKNFNLTFQERFI